MLGEAKTYYDTKGQFAGVYTMTPETSKMVGPNQCDIRYQYKNTSTGGVGYDQRRFTFTPDTEDCTWDATTMGMHMSGTTI